MNERKSLLNTKKLKSKSGITLIALVISIIVMLILAGVSISAIVGEDGVLTKAQEATYSQSIAVLQDYINEEYVNNYEEYDTEGKKIINFRNIHPEIFYNPASEGIGAVNYVVDSNGHALYLIKKIGLPTDLRESIAGGNAGNGTYQDYVNMNDVYGVTENLKVYYYSEKTGLKGITEEQLDEDNPNREVFAANSSFANLLGANGEAITAQQARSIRTLTINSTSNITNLSEICNLTSLETLILSDMHLNNLNGIENTTKLKTIYLKNFTCDDYSKIGGISNNLRKLFIVDTSDNEMDKMFGTYNSVDGKGIKNGLSQYDFKNLIILEISGALIDEMSFETGGFASNSYISNTRNSRLTKIDQLNNLSDITKKSITHLCINNNSITSLNGISGMTNLYLLRAEWNYIKDISALKNINLTYAYLNDNQIGLYDENALNFLDNSSGKHSKLYYLRLNGNNIIKVNKLVTYKNSTLGYLYIRGNADIIDISTIKDLNCYIDFDTKYALSMIASDTTYLDLRNQTLTLDNLIAIGTCSQLEQLSLNNVKIQDNNVIISDNGATATQKALVKTKLTEMLKKLKNLKALDLYNVGVIDDLSFVNSWNIDSYYYFRLDKTNITTLNPLNRFGNRLRYVSIKEAPCQINTLSDTALTPLLNCEGRATVRLFSSEWLCTMGLDETQATNFIAPQGLTSVYMLGSSVNLDFSNISTVKTINIRDSKAVFTFDPTSITSIVNWTNCIRFASGKTGGTVYAKVGNNDESFRNVLKTFTTIDLCTYNNNTDFNNYAEYCSKIRTLTQEPQFVQNWYKRGLNLLTNVTEINLNVNGTLDVSDMSSLNNLTKVTLYNVSNVNILNMLPLQNLTSLTLVNSQVSDISPLEKAMNLQTLNLYNSLIYDRISYTSISGEVRNNALSLQILLDLNKNHNLRNLYLEYCDNITDFSILQSGNWNDKRGF